MDLDEDVPTFGNPTRHIPTHEQSAFCVKEQLLRRSFYRCSFDNIDITPVQASFPLNPHTLIKTLDFARSVNLCVAFQFGHLFRTVVTKSTYRRLDPTDVTIKTLLQFAVSRKFNNA